MAARQGRVAGRRPAAVALVRHRGPAPQPAGPAPAHQHRADPRGERRGPRPRVRAARLVGGARDARHARCPVRRGYPHTQWGEFRDNALRAAREWQVLSYLDANPGAHQHSPETDRPGGHRPDERPGRRAAAGADDRRPAGPDPRPVGAAGPRPRARSTRPGPSPPTGRPGTPASGSSWAPAPSWAAPSTAASSAPAASSSPSSSRGTCGTPSTSPAAWACSGPATARPCTPSPDARPGCRASW